MLKSKEISSIDKCFGQFLGVSLFTFAFAPTLPSYYFLGLTHTWENKASTLYNIYKFGELSPLKCESEMKVDNK